MISLVASVRLIRADSRPRTSLRKVTRLESGDELSLSVISRDFRLGSCQMGELVVWEVVVFAVIE